jgi:hypothetical protein
MNMKREKITFGISIVAIIVSLLAIILVAFRIEPITFEWMGVLVGTLSILVMILLGWSILSVLDFRSIISEVKNQNLTLHANYEKHTAALSCTLYHVLFEFYAKKTDEVEPFIRYGLCYIDECLKLGNIDGANVAVKVMNECILETTEITLFSKKNLLVLLFKVKETKNLYGFDTLKDKIVRMPIVLIGNGNNNKY